MNAAHIHLLLNHTPVVGLLFLLPLLIYATARSHADYYRLALLGLVCVALLTIPVYLSGEGAEETVEHLPGFSAATHDILENHEDTARLALFGALALGALAFVFLLLEKYRPALFMKWRWAPVLLAIPTLAAFVATANLGGQIMHTEIRDASRIENFQILPEGSDTRAAEYTDESAEHERESEHD
ncbi:MAG: hypothetical protein NXI24_05485 [bacterium]|nr:hypothetical protein [bacterium]